ncbi:DNA N-6-adenine-methyltransferase [Vibrio phage 1.134.O._10N.222.52.B8]|nr:DNA N-6-adenine-methyltransferase [Vibrio phage 1.134.O._10N.222.52.B8]
MNTEHKSNTPVEIRDLWMTPGFIFDYYNRRFNFTCDVACSDENRLVRDHWLTEDDNALFYGTDWHTRNWCNPPYSNIRPWVEKAINEMSSGRLTVMLIPADTSVKWFKLAFDNCSECHFISGRLSFVNGATKKPVSGNNKGSVVFVFDPSSPFKSQTALISRDEMKGE